MQTISRRHFLGGSILGAAAAGYLASGALELGANPLGLPLGFQTYPVRSMIPKDFEGTLRQYAALGYQATEMCSPPGYGKDDFGTLLKFKPSEIRQMIHNAGLQCDSCHFQFREFKEKLGETIAYAKELGLKQMVVSTFSLPRDAAMDDWKRAAGDLNKFAVEVHKAGLEVGFHNHNMEFEKLDGVLIYDELMKAFDPKLVKMQFQVAVIELGYKAEDYFTKYPGRFISIHLQDWSPQQKETVAIGKGVVDWKKLFAAAKTAGVKNYFVEVSPEQIKESAPFLKELKVS